ncbi:flavodoxin family protein [Metallumcola ferriviriculae]|uniref:Flavodoxin family protein n=1 Tax=Metallumcola ferriviriculae TaxID=3039180 RepID=A0AAU0UR74_9FIRM|nr:flavodoxin family protein [Desulfitibacteraceae bacterium MK1]
MAKILAFVGSPRREGNSETLVAEFLKGSENAGAKTELIRLNALDIRLCQACDACAGSGFCVMRDDLRPIYAEIAAAAGLLIMTPIYFGSLSAQTKVFIDRFQCWWHAKYTFKRPFVNKEEKRPAFFMTVGAWKNKSYGQNAADIAKVYFTSINYRLTGELHYTGFDYPGSVAEAPAVLEEVYKAGKDFAREALKTYGAVHRGEE